MASVHRELAEKQSLAFSMTLLPTKLELTSTSAETTFIFEFSSPDTRSNFELAFEDAKKKLGKSSALTRSFCFISSTAIWERFTSKHYFPIEKNRESIIFSWKLYIYHKTN